MALKREHKIGLTMIAGVALLIFGLNYLKGIDLFKSRSSYYAVYNNVEGLTDASPLLFNGYKIGQVVGSSLLHDGTGHIAITYSITEKQLIIPEDSKIEIYSLDLFTKAAKLIKGTSTNKAEPGDTLIGDTQLSLTEAFSSELDPLKRKAEGMIASIDTVLSSLQAILNEGAQSDIDASFASIRATLENFKNTSLRLDDLVRMETNAVKSTLDNLALITDTLAAHNHHMGRILANFSDVSDTLAQAQLGRVAANLAAATTDLQKVLSAINAGEGTLGMLVHNDSLYHNLNSATHEMDLLLEDMRLNPSRYVQVSVFGKKEKKVKLSDQDIERIRNSMNNGQ